MRFKFYVGSLYLAILLMATSVPLHAQIAVGVVVNIAPPELPLYDQPLCPGEDYIWTPGYWDYDTDDSDYFWVPGTWVLAPEVGFLWTPPYWGWGGSGFVLTAGFWGPIVGFYGGVNYGFGYFGDGYYGGRWDRGHFFYNTEINRVDVTIIHNVYTEHVDVRNNTRVSFNGPGGVQARPTTQQEAAAHERHIPPVRDQVQHFQTARTNRDLHASVNHGAPPIAATPKAGAFNDPHVVRAGGGSSGGRAESNARTESTARAGANARTESNGSRTYTHPKDLPPAERPTAPTTGNAKQDQKYQQQQEKLYSKQQQERQKLQAQQDKEHQQVQKQQVSEARTQQLEQKHAQQTQQMQQRHTQQAQQLQQRQAPAAPRSSGGGKPK